MHRDSSIQERITMTRTRLQTAMRNNDSLCAQVVRFENGKTQEVECYGSFLYRNERRPVNPLTLFDVGIMTRFFTVLTLNELLLQRNLPPSTPVQQILPRFSGERPTGSGVMLRVNADKITIDQIVRHVAGLPESIPHAGIEDRDTLIDRLYKAQFVTLPNTDIRDSSVGYMLLGLIIEALTNTSLSQAITDYLLIPLGLTETGFRPVVPDAVVELPIPEEGIAPTFVENYNGISMRTGIVADPLCRKLGGESGNNGIFTTASEFAVIIHHLMTAIAALDNEQVCLLNSVRAYAHRRIEMHGDLDEKRWHVYLSNTGCVFLLNYPSCTGFVILTNGGAEMESRLIDHWYEELIPVHEVQWRPLPPMGVIKPNSPSARDIFPFL